MVFGYDNDEERDTLCNEEDAKDEMEPVFEKRRHKGMVKI